METNLSQTSENSDQVIETKESAVEPADGLKKIAASIIFGAMLISGSILYSGYSIVKNSSFVSNPNLAGEVKGEATDPVSIKSRNQEPVLGNKNAKVTIVEFADFQCPYCQSFFNQTFPEIEKKYIETGKVKYIFRHYPLSFHVNAEISSVAAECANIEGKFWEYHDLLFANAQPDGTNLALADLKKYGTTLGLGSKFDQCLDSKATLEIVKGDFSEGTKGGITGTPSFFINGQKLVGAQPFAKFEEAIEAALK